MGELSISEPERFLAGKVLEVEPMDPKELKDWCDFCEGTLPYESGMFHGMFMEMFSESLSEADRNDLRKVFSYVPNSSRALEKMFRMDDRADDRTEQEIVDLVLRDLQEKGRVIDDPELLGAMDKGVREIVVDDSRFQEVRQEALNAEFIHAVCDRVNNASPQNWIIYELSEAFYYLAHDLHLQHALEADLVNADINFDNYFDLYMIGVNYALDTTGVFVINHRAAHAETKIDPSWRTAAVMKLAKAIHRDNAFGRMPILGDALEDAGCTNADILMHCRGPLPHAPGCWVLDWLLTKDQPS
jgi:hypothetical protein